VSVGGKGRGGFEEHARDVFFTIQMIEFLLVYSFACAVRSKSLKLLSSQLSTLHLLFVEKYIFVFSFFKILRLIMRTLHNHSIDNVKA
jgi:hypothetical protein